MTEGSNVLDSLGRNFLRTLQASGSSIAHGMIEGWGVCFAARAKLLRTRFCEENSTMSCGDKLIH